jgi:hypothetical protein
VFKLQTRIYRASQRGDVKTVHRLQRLMLKSWSAKCQAVRRVTQDNQGQTFRVPCCNRSKRTSQETESLNAHCSLAGEPFSPT